MSRRLLSRVEKLERLLAPQRGVHYQYLQLVRGELSLEQVSDDTRRFLASILTPDGEVPDTIEEELAMLSRMDGPPA